MGQVFLITGGAGFIGSSLSRELSRRHGENSIFVVDNFSMGNAFEGQRVSPSIHIIESDMSNPQLVRSLLREIQPDVIFHLAANSDIAASSRSIAPDLTNTFATTASLVSSLEAVSANPHVIFASTSAIYGSHTEPLSEDSPKRPESPYGWMKLASEELLTNWASGSDDRCLSILRFPNVTGRGQTHGVVRDLVRKYLADSTPWEVLGNGHQTKPFIHVDDLIRVMLVTQPMLQNPGVYDLNIAPSDSVSVRQIAEEIERAFQHDRVPFFGSEEQGWEGDVPRYSYNTSKMMGLGISVPSSLHAIRQSILDEKQALS
jgi:UDP-glucose 4-epimerase